MNVLDFIGDIGNKIIDAGGDTIDWLLNDPLSFFGNALGTVIPGPSGSVIQNMFNSPTVASEASGVLSNVNGFDLSGYLGELFETSEKAAVNQAIRNEEASLANYFRNEEAANNAMERSRQLRQTYYQDLVQSLKEAGLNPVLAASGGIGSASVSAPQGSSSASQSGMASGINAADLIGAVANLLSSAGSLVKSFSPVSSISEVIDGQTGELKSVTRSYKK